MPWPLSQDYNEAIQSPATNFADADLKKGEATTNALGLPVPFSGNFADVYQVRCPNGSRWAVKCFTREVPGLRERYQEISAWLSKAKLPFSVEFSYLEQGIRVRGQWFPILKMQWVEGLTLNQFVAQYLDKPAMLEALLQLWAKMGKYLRAAKIGHCDLQHGNVLLVPGSTPNALALKLIDYDGMWVPSLAWQQDRRGRSSPTTSIRSDCARERIVWRWTDSLFCSWRRPCAPSRPTKGYGPSTTTATTCCSRQPISCLRANRRFSPNC